MPLTSDPLDILLAQDAWCTRTLLEHCRPLTKDQFHKKFEIGLGDLHTTITHIISATRRWTDRIAGRTPRPFLHPIPSMPQISGDAKDRTIDELLALHEEAAKDLAKVAAASREKGFTQILTLEFAMPGEAKKRYQFTHGTAMVHVTTHATHHRAQCVNMLRHLNVPGVSDKLPDLEAIAWQSAVEAPPVPL
jgi:uncharacterized damage-inducible protein DinB